MALTLINTIAALNLVKNPLAVKLQTDAFITGVATKCRIVLDFTGGTAAADESFTWDYPEIDDEQEFVFKASPDSSGLQLPAYSAGTTADWLDTVIPYLNKNYYIKRDWNVSRDGDNIVIEAKVVGTDYSATGVNNVADMNYSITAGQDNTIAENFSIVLDTYVAGVLVSSQNLVPDDDQYAVFQIAEILLSQLTGYFPVYAFAAPALAVNVYKSFTLIYCEYYGDPPTYKGITESSSYVAVRGGFSFPDYPGSAYYPTWIQANKRFMTWKDTTRRVTTTQKEFLNFLNHSATATSLILKCKMYYSDGTDSTATAFTEASVAQKEIWCFPAGYTQIAVDTLKTAGKTVTKYQLWIEDHASNVISEVITHVMESKYFENSRTFYFENSLGGIDSLRATGKREDNIIIERSLTEKILDDYWSSTTVSRQTENYDNSYSFEYAISSGYKEKKEAISRMIELLISTDVRVDDGEKWIPVVIRKDSFKLYKDQDDEWFLSFEYSDAFSNKAYSEM
jgi:hypothetical protein